MAKKKNEIQKPTVGRIVHLDVVYGTPYAGIIVGVNNNDTINVVCWDSKGRQTTYLSIYHKDTEPLPAVTWDWPKRV